MRCSSAQAYILHSMIADVTIRNMMNLTSDWCLVVVHLCCLSMHNIMHLFGLQSAFTYLRSPTKQTCGGQIDSCLIALMFDKACFLHRKIPYGIKWKKPQS